MKNSFAFRRRRRGLTLLELVMVVSILAILTALVVPGMTDQQETTRAAVAKTLVKDVSDTIANKYAQDMADTLGYQGLPRVNTRMTSGGPEVDDATRVSTATGGTTHQLFYLPQLCFLLVNPRQFDSSLALGQRYAAIPDYDPSVKLGWNGPYFQNPGTTYPNPADRRFPRDPNDTRVWSDFGFTLAHGQPGDPVLLDPWGSPIVISVQLQTHGGVDMYSAYVVSAGPNKTLDIAPDTTTGAITPGDDIIKLVKQWK